jgi:hypothetical protein
MHSQSSGVTTGLAGSLLAIFLSLWQPSSKKARKSMSAGIIALAREYQAARRSRSCFLKCLSIQSAAKMEPPDEFVATISRMGERWNRGMQTNVTSPDCVQTSDNNGSSAAAFEGASCVVLQHDDLVKPVEFHVLGP